MNYLPLPQRSLPFLHNWADSITISAPVILVKPHHHPFPLLLYRTYQFQPLHLPKFSWSLAHINLPLSEIDLITWCFCSEACGHVPLPTKWSMGQATHTLPCTPSSSLPGFWKFPGLLSILCPESAFTHRLTRMPSPVPPFHSVLSAPPQGKVWKSSSNLLIQNYQHFI